MRSYGASTLCKFVAREIYLAPITRSARRGAFSGIATAAPVGLMLGPNSGSAAAIVATFTSGIVVFRLAFIVSMNLLASSP